LRLIEGATGESLEKIQDEINFFLEEKDEKEMKEQKTEKAEEKSTDQSNPFVALVGGYGKPSAEPKEKKGKKEKWWPEKESFAEEASLRPLAEEKAKETTFKIFDTYKKAHGMPSYT